MDVRLILLPTLFVTFFLNCTLKADDTLHQVVRRVVVFPIDTSGQFVESASDAWWEIRETLTKERRFLVASKRFMEQKDVFQPRTKLSAPDAILLGKLLEAHALISMTLENRELYFRAYSGHDGFLLWEQKVNLHPSLPISGQLKDASVQAMKTFIASIPYQGSQIIDPLIGESVYEDGDVQLAKIEISPESQVKAGDNVQWIEVHRLNTKPLFQSGGQINVIAEGRVASRDRAVLIVEVNRAKDIKALGEKTAVRFPKETARLKSQLSESIEALSLDVVKSPMRESKTETEETKPLVAAILGILNVVALILLAF